MRYHIGIPRHLSSSIKGFFVFGLFLLSIGLGLQAQTPPFVASSPSGSPAFGGTFMQVGSGYRDTLGVWHWEHATGITGTTSPSTRPTISQSDLHRLADAYQGEMGALHADTTHSLYGQIRNYYGQNSQEAKDVILAVEIARIKFSGGWYQNPYANTANNTIASSFRNFNWNNAPVDDIIGMSVYGVPVALFPAPAPSWAPSSNSNVVEQTLTVNGVQVLIRREAQFSGGNQIDGQNQWIQAAETIRILQAPSVAPVSAGNYSIGITMNGTLHRNNDANARITFLGNRTSGTTTISWIEVQARQGTAAWYSAKIAQSSGERSRNASTVTFNGSGTSHIWQITPYLENRGRPGETYDVRARIRMSNGSYTNWVEQSFKIDNRPPALVVNTPREWETAYPGETKNFEIIASDADRDLHRIEVRRRIGDEGSFPTRLHNFTFSEKSSDNRTISYTFNHPVGSKIYFQVIAYDSNGGVTGRVTNGVQMESESSGETTEPAPTRTVSITGQPVMQFGQTQTLGFTSSMADERGNATFRIVGSSGSNVATLNGNQLIANTGTGWVRVEVEVTGGSAEPATSPVAQINFTRAPQSMSLNAPTSLRSGDSSTLSVSGAPGSGAVTYSVVSGECDVKQRLSKRDICPLFGWDDPRCDWRGTHW